MQAYKVIVPLNDSIEAWNALEYAIQLCQSISPSRGYKLLLCYIVALNPPNSLPYLDHLDRANNLEIQSKAAKELERCKSHLKERYEGTVSYELVEVEGEGETAPLIAEFVKAQEGMGKVDVVVVGSKNMLLGGLRKWVVGSVSGMYSWASNGATKYVESLGGDLRGLGKGLRCRNGEGKMRRIARMETGSRMSKPDIWKSDTTVL